MRLARFVGKENWALFVDNAEKWKFGGESFSKAPTEAATAPTTRHALAATGAVSSNVQSTSKNVMISDQRDTVPIPCATRSRIQNQDMDCAANTPPAPPKKRHCRSLSIPGDTSSTGKSGSGSGGRKWQPSGGGVWRPVGLRAHGNSKLCKNRNSPLSSHHQQHYNHRSYEHAHHRGAGHDAHGTATVFQCSSKVGGAGGMLHRGLTAVRSLSPTLSVSTINRRHSTHQFLPFFSTAAPAGTGGALVGAAAGAAWPLSKSEDFSTPPESPVPRPHSASSGFWESSGSLNSFRPETKNQQNSLSSLSNAQQRAMDAFRMRSLSMEEPMTRRSLPMCSSAAGARSMPAIPGCNTGLHTGTTSMPSSPRRQRVPRCRSQPCVLLDRKCLKRRRDENRPKLDFLKMKEVTLALLLPSCSDITVIARLLRFCLNC